MPTVTCPNCHASLELSLSLDGTKHKEKRERPHAFVVDSREYELTLSDVRRAIGNVHRPVHESYVSIEDEAGKVRKLPTKELIRQAILLKYPEIQPATTLGSYSSFQTQRAEHIARALGLNPQRRGLQR